MSIKNIVSRILREEYDNTSNKLYGYHVTLNNPETIETIKQNGFKVGKGNMEGQGFYAFYDLDRACGYSSKEHRTNYIVKFEITNISKLLILNMSIAYQLYGYLNEHHIADQLERCLPRGLISAYMDYKNYQPSKTLQDYRKTLEELESHDPKEIGLEFFEMHTGDLSNYVNVVSYGTYGLQYRINDTSIAKPVGLYELEPITRNIINYTSWE
jgi:hypothetical protein